MRVLFHNIVRLLHTKFAATNSNSYDRGLRISDDLLLIGPVSTSVISRFVHGKNDDRPITYFYIINVSTTWLM